MAIKKQIGYSFHKNKLHRTSIQGRNKTDKKELYLILCVFALTFFIINTTLNRITLNMVENTIKGEGINYDYFREMILPIELLHKNDESSYFSEEIYNVITLNTFLQQNNYPSISKLSKDNQKKLIYHLSNSNQFQELKGYYKSILKDIHTFPIAREDKNKISYSDSWNYLRSYGGNRKHEGTDIMSSENKAGVIPILSMTDGYVEKMGWLEKGGYRIGIRSENGVYFYYAHLASYAEGLKEGKKIKAGDCIGLMGDSGYGSEGTTGKFPVHLHVGIYLNTSFGEVSVNPYLILKYLDQQ